MINRILTRLLKIPKTTVIRSFSSFDDSNKGGRGGSKFFGRKDKGKEVSIEPEREDERKETHHKTVNFMKKHELKKKELEGQPKKELRFRKKDGFEQAETEKPSPFVRPLGEENEEEEIKKSIFFAKGATPSSEQPQSTPKSFSLPQLN